VSGMLVVVGDDLVLVVVEFENIIIIGFQEVI